MKTFLKKHSLLSFSLVLTFSLLCGLKLISNTTTAQTTRQQQETKLPPWQERVVPPRRLTSHFQRLDTSAMTERIIENQIPSHLPIKVELRNLDREPLLRNLEIKVTNLSNKPIYSLTMFLWTPEIVPENNAPISFNLVYGRFELQLYEEKVRPDDIPLQPGESYIFKVPENNAEAFERRLAKMGLTPSQLKIFYLNFYHLKFGDNTGFRWPSGESFPKLNSKCSPNAPRGQPNEQKQTCRLSASSR